MARVMVANPPRKKRKKRTKRKRKSRYRNPAKRAAYNYKPKRANYGGSNLSLNPMRIFGKSQVTAYDIAAVLGGWIGNQLVSAFAFNRLPESIKSKTAMAALGISSAGVLSAVSAKISPRYGANVMLGGIAAVLMDLIRPHLGGSMNGMGKLGCCGSGPGFIPAYESQMMNGFIPPFQDTNVTGLGAVQEFSALQDLPAIDRGGDNPSRIDEGLWGSRFTQSAALEMGDTSGLGDLEV